jgi:hypothetical protein
MKNEINKGHYLELMDRLAVQTDVIHNYIYEHPLAENHPDIQKKIESALSNLYEAYQLVGNKEGFYEDENNAH